jgi:hypothetical protein
MRACCVHVQELTEFPIMCIGAEKVVRRYVPPRMGKLTLVVVDGFAPKVTNITFLFVNIMRVLLIMRFLPRNPHHAASSLHTPQDTYRVLSAADRDYINEIARQSGDLLTMTTYGVQSYKLRYNEGIVVLLLCCFCVAVSWCCVSGRFCFVLFCFLCVMFCFFVHNFINFCAPLNTLFTCLEISQQWEWLTRC